MREAGAAVNGLVLVPRRDLRQISVRERKKGEEGVERERAKEEKKEKEVEVGREKNHRTSKCLPRALAQENSVGILSFDKVGTGTWFRW